MKIAFLLIAVSKTHLFYYQDQIIKIVRVHTQSKIIFTYFYSVRMPP